MTKRIYDAIIIYSAYLFGGGSLLLFGVFLLFGPLGLIDYGLSTVSVLVLDALLSMLFFIQHSLMVRQSFRKALASRIPVAYHPAVYAIVSGFILTTVVCCWQTTGGIIVEAGNVMTWGLRLLFAAAVFGFFWGVRSLDYFDPLGEKSIQAQNAEQEASPAPIVIKGPYRWVRHPLYFFALIMIWAHPVVTADRLLFNLLWTFWIFAGAVLEEKDLVHDYGNSYRRYQEQVPMLIPIRIRPLSNKS